VTGGGAYLISGGLNGMQLKSCDGSREKINFLISLHVTVAVAIGVVIGGIIGGVVAGLAMGILATYLLIENPGWRDVANYAISGALSGFVGGAFAFLVGLVPASLFSGAVDALLLGSAPFFDFGDNCEEN